MISSFEKLFEYAEEIPCWLISYNNRSYPSVKEFEKFFQSIDKLRLKQNLSQRQRRKRKRGRKPGDFIYLPTKAKIFLSTNQQGQLANEGL